MKPTHGAHADRYRVGRHRSSEVTRGLVTVRADLAVKATVEQLNRAFGTFKAEHSKQLDDVKKGQADALLGLMVENINAHITELQAAVDAANTKMAAIEMGGAGASTVKDKEYTAAFSAHMKHGDANASPDKGRCH